MSAPSSPTERSPLLAAPGNAGSSTSSPSRPSYRQRALSRASGNPLPQPDSPVLGNGNVDLPVTEYGAAEQAADAAEEEGDLDPVAALQLRRKQRARRLLWRRVLAAVLLFLLISGIVLAIVLPLTIGRRGGAGGRKDKDVPDLTKLPPPKPGGRNPSYLVSGWGGAVASEEERCSKIGVESALSSLFSGFSRPRVLTITSSSSPRKRNGNGRRHRNRPLRRRCQLVLLRNWRRRLPRPSPTVSSHSQL